MKKQKTSQPTFKELVTEFIASVADQRIHQHIYQCARNPYLARTLDEYYVLSLRIWHLAVDRTPELRDAVLEHRMLLEAINVNDAKTADRLMREHVRDFEQAMRRVLVGGA